jgi:hypothetical protein
VFPIGLLIMHWTELRKERKKAKSHNTQAQNKSRCKTEVFLWSLLTYLSLHYLVILVPQCSVLISHGNSLCLDSMWHSIR